MKVALLCESQADQDGLFHLVEGVLGSPINRHPLRIAARFGWPSLANALPALYKALHYQHPDVDALVVVADSDDSLVHLPGHEPPGTPMPGCRLCELRAAIGSVEQHVRTVARAARLLVAIGVAVPSIEAWWRFGRDPHVSEAIWRLGQQQPGSCPYSRVSLKEDCYGIKPPVPSVVTREVAAREADRLIQEGRLDTLESSFPNGFGSLARTVRSWRRT